MNIAESNLHVDEYLDFQKYWLVMKRRWPSAIVTFIGVLSVFSICAFSLEPLYKGEARILIKTNRSATLTGIENETGQIDVISQDSDPLATEAEIVRSRPIVNRLIQELDLRDDDGELVKYKDFIDNLKVKTVSGTDVLEITYKDKDPEQAASVVNKAIQTYKQQDTLSNRTEAGAARAFIIEQLPQVETNVKKAEAELREFKNKYQIANLSEETTATISNLSGLENQINVIRADLEDVEVRYSRLSSQLGVSWQEASAVAALSQSVAVQNIFGRLQQINLNLVQRRNYLSENNPQIISLRGEVAELQQALDLEIAKTFGTKQQSVPKNLHIILGELSQGQIAEFANLGLEREGLQKRLATLKNIYRSNKHKSDILPQLEEEQNELARRVAAAQSTYETLLNKLQEARIAEEQDIGKVRVVSQAVIPEESVEPSKKKIIAGGGILGSLLGVAVAFLLDIKDNTIKNTKEAEEILPYPLQGVIPNFNKIEQGSQNHSLAITSSNAVKNLPLAIREAFQDVQVNLQLLELESKEKIKIIAVTSAVAGEGKSSISANYAAGQSQCGKKTLLIDSDLRRPTQHVFWRVSNQVGLTNVVNQELSWQEAVQNVMPNLDILTAGTIPDNPVTVLNSLSFGIAMMNLTKHYDQIILDTPPLVGLADTKILRNLVDGFLFVIRPGVASYSSISSAKKTLETYNFKVLGVVANGVDVTKEPFGYGYYYPDPKYLEVS